MADNTRPRGASVHLPDPGQVAICDLKGRSLKCFKGLEGVTLTCQDIAEIHTAIIGAYHRGLGRNELADPARDVEKEFS